MSLQQYLKILQGKAMQQGIPLAGGFEITPRCNLRCKMCYVRENSGSIQELSTKEWIHLGREAADAGALSAFITGGEPLIREDFREIYDAFCRLGIRLTLFTNATLIDEEFAKWLSSTPPATTEITLYGASEDTYGRLCGEKEAYGKTINGIELLLKYGLNIRIKSTVVKSNAEDYEAIKKKAEAYGVEFFGSRLIHGNRTSGISLCENERLSPDEFLKQEFEHLDEYDCKPLDIDEMVSSFKDLPAMSCYAGRCGFFLNWNGRMTPCPLFSDIYTEPLAVGYLEAWRQLREMINGIPRSAECVGCDLRAFCPVCPPRLYLETGRYDAPAEYICAIARKKREFVEHINVKASERMS